MARISLFSPLEGDYTSRSAELARQQKLAQMLMEMSQQEMPVSTAGGITAPVSPYGALAKALTSFGGSYLSGKSAADEADLKKSDQEMAQAALKNFYALPDFQQLALSKQPAAPTSFDINVPSLPGQVGPQDVAASVALPGVSRPELATVAGRATTPQEQMQKLAPLMQGGETSRSVYNAFMPQVMQQQAANIKEEKEKLLPKFAAAGTGGQVDTNPNSPTFGKTVGAPGPKPANLPPSVEEALWYQNASPQERAAFDKLKTAGRSVTNVNVGPTGIDYGKPADGLVWKRDQSGKVVIDDRGAPIAIPYQGSKAYNEAQSTETANKNKNAQQQLKNSIVSQEIDAAKKIMDKAETPTTGIVGAATKNIPGTPSNELRGHLETIRANIGFDQLQKMREASPTGGALGQVAVQEVQYLQSLFGAIEQNQTTELLKKNLDRLNKEVYRVVNGPEAAARAFSENPTAKRKKFNPVTGELE